MGVRGAARRDAVARPPAAGRRASGAGASRARARDFTTLPLRRFLRERGYAPYPWELGFNFGPRAGVLEACVERVRSLQRQHGRPVSLIGWSLGGVYAREVAKEMPDATRCVITLGTPFTGHPRATNAWRFYEFVSGHAATTPRDGARAPPPPVPTTSIYSRSDGIVAWQCSVNEAEPQAENIEIHASHVGMGMNPLALYARSADRLAQDPRGVARISMLRRAALVLLPTARTLAAARD